MAMVMKASLVLRPGCRLLCKPPQGSTVSEYMFFRKNYGRDATFEGHPEYPVGPLDPSGRMPGLYIDQDTIKVRFEGEETISLQKASNFIVCEPLPNFARLAGKADGGVAGDLSVPILFYPDDYVRLPVQSEPQRVLSVSFHKSATLGDVLQCEIVEPESEWKKRREELQDKAEKSRIKIHSLPHHSVRVFAEKLELVSRGNVWALYNAPDQMSFESDEAELKFWGRSGIARDITDPHDSGMFLEEAWTSFMDNEVDIIFPHPVKDTEEVIYFSVKRLHDCWAEHREHVRGLVHRMWADKVNQSAA